jgi:predicted RND superfamily exporter protein
MRWRWPIIIMTLIIIAVAARGMRQLTLTTDYRVFFSDENPQLVAFDTLQNTYTKNDNILIAIAPKDRKVFTRETLAVVEELTREAWQIPYSLRVDSVTNFQHTHANGDELIVEDLVSDAGNLLDSDIERIKNIALNEPLLLHRLIPPLADVAGVNVTIQVPGIKPQSEIPQAVEFTRALVARLADKYQHVEFHLSGTVMMNNAFVEAAKADYRSLMPLMFAVVSLCLWWMLRSISGVLLTVLVVVFSVMFSMGVTGWMGVTLTPPTGSVPTIILTLAIADCVHLLISYFNQLQQGGGDRKAAMAESLRINLQPVTLTSLTTAVGFLSMNFSDAPPFRDLGNMVAIGVVAAWLLAILFLPAAMSLLPGKPRTSTTSGQSVMVELGEFVIRNYRVLLWANVVLAVFLALMIPKNEINDQFVEYFDDSIEFRRDTDFVTDHLTGIYTIDYSLSAGAPGALNEPLFLHNVEKLANWYRSQPEVIHVNVFTDVMKRLNKNLHGDDPAYYTIPEERELAAQYLLLYEMSLPYGLDLNNQIDIDKSATRMNVTVSNLRTRQLLELEARAHEWMVENMPASMQTPGASPAIMFGHIGLRNLQSMMSGNILALFLISFILILAFRSIKIGLVSLLPNLFPAMSAFGVWAILVGEVGVSLSVVIGMTIGIVVDDTIHFLSKYLRARREQDLAPADAVRYAFSTVGTAMWVTSAVLIAGFSVLAFSAFKMNAGMGLLTAITIAMALLLDFLFLPALLLAIGSDKRDVNKFGEKTA